MSPKQNISESLKTNSDCCSKVRYWPLWLLGGLMLLFLITIIVLRGLCTDVWYIKLLNLNDSLCNGKASIQQKLNLSDGSIRGSEIAEGAIGLDKLSSSLQLSINNINNQLTNPTSGPAGPSGLTGATGAVGTNGATGPAGAAGAPGPSDPCSSLTTFFCQSGNSFGSGAVLGTNDANSLAIETFGTTQATIAVGGATIFENSSNSTSGFRVNNAASVTVLNVDTTNSRVGINTSLPAEALEVSGNAKIDMHSATGADAVIDDVSLLTPGQTGWVVNNNVEKITDVDSYDRVIGVSGNLLVDPATDVTSGFHVVYGVEGALAIDPSNIEDMTVVTLAGVRGAVDSILASGDVGAMRGGDFGATWAGFDTLGSQAGVKTTAAALIGTITDQKALDAQAVIALGGVVTNSYGGYFSIVSDGSAAIGTSYGIRVITPENSAGAGSWTTNYGVYIDDQTASAAAIGTTYNLYSEGSSAENIIEGNVGIGQTSTTNRLDVTDISDDTPASFTGTSGTCTVDTFGGGWSCVSDQKLKTNILSINNGLEAVLALQGVTYNWKSSPDSRAVSGFVAQEVEKVLPGLVAELSDGTKTLNKDGIIPYLVEAVKTQNGKLDETNQQITSQGLRIDNLSEELKTLAGRVDTLQQEFNDYKVSTDARINELEKKLNNQVPATSPAQP